MNFKKFYQILDRHKYYIFSIEDILSLYPGQNKSNIKKSIYRWTKKKWIYSLKRGLFELVYPGEFHIPDLFIANKMYDPSYISLETALSHYSIIPEISMAVTSLTTKPTRRFKNKHGLFIYRTIKPSAFTGYSIEQMGDYRIHIAEPEKALVDYLYFRTLRNKKISFKEDRFDKHRIAQLNKSKIRRYVKLYNIPLKELYAYL